MQSTEISLNHIRRGRKSNGRYSFERMEASEIIFRILSYLLATVFALFCLYPLIYCISSAFSGRVAVDAGDIILFPIDVQFDAFMTVVNDPSFWPAYCNTFFITFFGTIYCMLVSILGGYALSKKNLFGNKTLNFLVVFTMWFTAGMVPVFQNYLATMNAFKAIGITDEKWMIVISMGMNAFNILLLRNAFEMVPKEIEEAALVDGATDFQIMWKVYVPMSKATIATVALFYAISRWNGYFWASRVISNDLYKPLQVVIQERITLLSETVNNGAINLGTYSEQSVIYSMVVAAIIPIILIYPFIQKYFAAGVNLGGVKE